MRILFLPNFAVNRLNEDDPAIPPANKIVDGEGYWFFRTVPDISVDVLDNRAPAPLRKLSDLLRVEFHQALRAFVAQNDYDAIISHSYSSAFIFSILRSATRKYSPPHYVIDIGCLNGNRLDGFQIPLIKRSLKSIDGVIYHSRINERLYSRHFPRLRRKFVMFGIDTCLNAPLNSTPTNEYVLSIGRAKRDYDTLVKAWRDIDFPLKIVGPSRIDTEGCEKIEVIPEVSIAELVTLIHNSRFIVLPIKGVPYSIGQMTTLLCMAMKKATIVTDVPGIRDYVVDGVNSITIPEGSADRLVSAARLLFDRQDLTDRIAAQARADTVEKFDEKTMAAEIVSFISEHPNEIESAYRSRKNETSSDVEG